MKCWYACLALLAASPVALADREFAQARQVTETSHFERTSADVETVKRDAQGRESVRTIQHWDRDTVYQGKTVIEHTWKSDRRTEMRRTQYDATNHVTTIEITAFSEPLPQRPHVEVRLTTGDWALLRTEVSDTEPSPDGSVLTTTVVRDGQDALIETRYSLSRVIRETTGRGARAGYSSTDISVFDAAGVETSRTLIEWRGPRMNRWTFDSNDDIRQHEAETRTSDAEGRTVTVSSDTWDADKVQIAGREESFVYEGPNAGMSRHEITWYDGQGTATQRRTSRTLFQGNQPAGARVTWESWQPTTTEP